MLTSCLLTRSGIGAGFYLGYSWLPSSFIKHVGIPQSTTLWMVLSGMIVFTFVVPVSGATVFGYSTASNQVADMCEYTRPSHYRLLAAQALRGFQLLLVGCSLV